MSVRISFQSADREAQAQVYTMLNLQAAHKRAYGTTKRSIERRWTSLDKRDGQAHFAAGRCDFAANKASAYDQDVARTGSQTFAQAGGIITAAYDKDAVEGSLVWIRPGAGACPSGDEQAIKADLLPIRQAYLPARQI